MPSTTQNITMPRKTKRKLSLSQNVKDVIPYSKVRVEWIDILSDSGWADEKGFNKMRLAYPVRFFESKAEKFHRSITFFSVCSKTIFGLEIPYIRR